MVPSPHIVGFLAANIALATCAIEILQRRFVDILPTRCKQLFVTDPWRLPLIRFSPVLVPIPVQAQEQPFLEIGFVQGLACRPRSGSA